MCIYLSVSEMLPIAIDLVLAWGVLSQHWSVATLA